MTSPETPKPPANEPHGPNGPLEPQPPRVEPRDRWMPSLVWAIPLLAALIGISLVVRTMLQSGPTITITLVSADGIEPGKTPVKFKDVAVGEVKSVTLSKDLSHVLVKVDLSKQAENFAVDDTRFWVVRPRVAASGVSGLSTLLSGAYIGVDVGRSHESRTEFVGLETPPAVTRDQQGRQYVLHGESLGSLDIGSPVYYRRVQVGQVVAFNLDPDGTGVTLRVFVNAPYDQYVGANTRFWHASGVDVRLDSSGFRLNTQSLAAVVLGGIAFQSPPGEAAGTAAGNDAAFTLSADQSDAMREVDGKPVTVVMNFNQSLRGLSQGAQIDFRGIVLGEVKSIGIDYDPTKRKFTMPVTVDLYPARLGSRFSASIDPSGASGRDLLLHLVQSGLRAQLRTGNLLTGQLYIALDFFPNVVPVKLDLSQQPYEIPTIPNTLDQLQLQVADIARKLDQVPFDQIGTNLNLTLQNANALFKQLNTEVAPQARATLSSAQHTFDSAQRSLAEDSPVQSDVRQAMEEITRTAQSLNVLADYLQRHPEALLRGKPGDK